MDWIQREREVLINLYSRQNVVLERGKGCYLYDTEGKRYLDLVAGIATVSIGHCNPLFIEKIKNQLDKLIHTSNLYYTIPQIQLAEKLREITNMDKFFFCNSGAESVEASLKFARKVTRKKKFIAFTGSFHGRTFGALSVTFKQRFREPFKPLLDHVIFCEFNDPDELSKHVDDETAAVILELVQGEAGVYPATQEFVKAIFELKDEYDFVVIFDEVQTGFGRTGSWFAKDHFNVRPDIMTMAKAMGSGIPIGCTAVTNEVAEKLEPGDHASTFGGNPLACTASLATIEIMENQNLIENSRKMGEYFRKKLSEIFIEVRGLGLMIGCHARNAYSIVEKSLSRGLLVNATSEDTLRFVPPLIVGKEEIDFAIDVLEEVAKE
ncbi:MAG TPA: aspartate aminotransferase family protein [Archaeoglobus sp.]|nr:aspartate aminotransferase family protein [Archaeoglobus sp.]